MKTLQDKLHGAVKELEGTKVYPLIEELKKTFIERGYLTQKEQYQLKDYIVIACKEKYTYKKIKSHSRITSDENK